MRDGLGNSEPDAKIELVHQNIGRTRDLTSCTGPATGPKPNTTIANIFNNSHTQCFSWTARPGIGDKNLRYYLHNGREGQLSGSSKLTLAYTWMYYSMGGRINGPRQQHTEQNKQSNTLPEG
jgi:hypothetical protein